MSTGPAAAINFVALYRDQRRGVTQYFTRRIRDGELAADLMAETYVQALSSAARFSGDDEDAVRWLYGIAHHVLTHYRRHAEAVDAALLRVPLERDVDGDAERDDILRDDSQPALRRALQPALNGLPDAHRAALALRVVDDLPYADIASRLNIDAALARARVSRALRALAASLAGADTESLH